MLLRSPLDLSYALGGLAWPVGFLAFGGFDDGTGRTIIGVGSVVILGSLGVELALRRRDRRRARRAAARPPRD